MFTLTGYHATDEQYVNDIITDKFTFKRNPAHWLGNGIYFFLDESLAEWWATGPSKKFGSPIKKRAILECTFQVGTDQIVDLRSLEHYQFFTKVYFNDFLKYVINVDEATAQLDLRMRCSFCDYFARNYEISGIIGNFFLPNQPYLPKESHTVYRHFGLPYIETQLCVFNQDIIINKIRKE